MMYAPPILIQYFVDVDFVLSIFLWAVPLDAITKCLFIMLRVPLGREKTWRPGIPRRGDSSHVESVLRNTIYGTAHDSIPPFTNREVQLDTFFASGGGCGALIRINN
jgi:hypothetical protein